MQRKDELTQQLFELKDEIDQNKKELQKELAEVRVALEKTLGQIKTRTEEAHVGEIGCDFVGLLCIFFGISFSTVPELIEMWFRWLIRAFEVF